MVESERRYDLGKQSPLRDMYRKIEEYFGAGAKQVWHLFPEQQSVIVYTSPSEAKTYSAEDEINAGDLLPGFHCRVKELFALE